MGPELTTGVLGIVIVILVIVYAALILFIPIALSRIWHHGAVAASLQSSSNQLQKAILDQIAQMRVEQNNQLGAIARAMYNQPAPALPTGSAPRQQP